jgi:hypothetical protein
VSTVKIAILLAAVVGLTGLVARNDEKDDKDEQQTRASKAVAGQQTAAQKPAEKPAADEGEEGERSGHSRCGSCRKTCSSTNVEQAILDSDTPGQLPAKFHSTKTGGGSQEKWVVSADPTAPSKPNVVTQASTDQTDYRFPLLISDEGAFQNLDLSVKFKAVSGNIDRAGGLVFRLKDANNYYIVRANALENNYRLYHVVNGRRSQFAGANLKVTSGEWHELAQRSSPKRGWIHLPRWGQAPPSSSSPPEMDTLR